MKPLNDAAGCGAKRCAIGTTGVLSANPIGKAVASAQAAQNLHSCWPDGGCGWSGVWQSTMIVASSGIVICSIAARSGRMQTCMAE